MLRARFVIAAFAVASLTLLPGGLTLFSKTEVIRGGEPRRPIRFGNSEAADTFNKAIYSKDRQLSDSAHFNDCVVRCGTDQDGTITLAEARMFKELKD